ncbi:zinc finger and BTB domain-containing protein 6 [Anolis carolinensis]|uniref:zinc finger and BTB domain-containing protein 6 n=1 Tax=Anolis carolinensis TaxID=28377 RepID=UPI002F2B320C
MAADSDVLHFRFEHQGEAVLRKMDLLRQQNLFCDVSIYINDTEFPGHKVIFAACSTFMRDQFLLSQSQQVRITILQSAEVGRKLLLSCYTGALEVKRKELLKYLTAASYLQMVHIVEKCSEALSKYLEMDAGLDGDRCHSSDMDGTADGDCEVIEIPEDSPVHVKREKGPEIPPVEDEEEICVFQMGPDVDDDDDNSERFAQPSTSSEASLYFPETQHSLINSTVESRMSAPFPGFGAEAPVAGAGPPGEAGPSAWRHQCPKCPRGFLHLENYLRHLKMHKLFLCLQCGKTFTQKKNLNRHIRGHMGIRPFQCAVCLKTFTAKSTLQDHLNIHSGDRPYKCHLCDMDFKHKSALKKHLTSVHAKAPPGMGGMGGLGGIGMGGSIGGVTQVRIDYD